MISRLGVYLASCEFLQACNLGAELRVEFLRSKALSQRY